MSGSRASGSALPGVHRAALRRAAYLAPGSLLIVLALRRLGEIRAPGIEAMALRGSRPIEFQPGLLLAQVVCDDVSLVQVEGAGDHFLIRGLSPGTTLCSFTAIAGRSGRRRLLEVVVTP